MRGKEQTSVDIIYSDLSTAFKTILKYSLYPTLIRRTFAEFITLSQQLTEVMRSTYKKGTGQEWCANNFKGWCEVTNLFKLLRRHSYHSEVITHNVQITLFFPNGTVEAIFPKWIKHTRRDDIISFTNFVKDWIGKYSYSVEIPIIPENESVDLIKIMSNCRGDVSEIYSCPKRLFWTRESKITSDCIIDKTSNSLIPSKVDIRYKINCHEKNIKESLRKIGTDDISLLTKKTFNVYKKYYKYFIEMYSLNYIEIFIKDRETGYWKLKQNKNTKS